MNKYKFLSLVFVGVAFFSCSMFKKDKSATTASNTETQTEKVDSVFNWVDFTTGYAQAKSENKYLLVDVYTDWCGWCKVMDKKTYTDMSVIKELAKNYVCVKLNPEKNLNYTMDGTTYSALQIKNILSENRSDGYPSTYFMKPAADKKVVAVVGYIEAKDFYKYLTTDIPAKL